MALVTPQPKNKSFGRVMFDSFIGQPVSDAWWSVTNPVDRLMGRGRAANPMMAFPLGGRYAPRTPGLRAEIARPGDPTLGVMGGPKIVGEFHHPLEQAEARGMSTYNLRNADNTLIGAASSRNKGPKDVYVDEMFIHPQYRHTGALLDLLNIVSRGGKRTVGGSIVNPRLATVAARKNDPKRLLKLEAAEVRRMAEKKSGQATNRELNPRMAPVKRLPIPARKFEKEERWAAEIARQEKTKALSTRSRQKRYEAELRRKSGR